MIHVVVRLFFNDMQKLVIFRT